MTTTTTTEAPTANPYTPVTALREYLDVLRKALDAGFDSCHCPECVARRSAPAPATPAPVPTNDPDAAAWAQQATAPVPAAPPADTTPPAGFRGYIIDALRARHAAFGPCDCPKCVAKRAAPAAAVPPVPTNDPEAAAWAEQATAPAVPVPPAWLGRSVVAPVGPSKADALLTAYVRATAVAESARRAARDADALALRLTGEAVAADNALAADVFAGADPGEAVRYATSADAVYRVARPSPGLYAVALLGTNVLV